MDISSNRRFQAIAWKRSQLNKLLRYSNLPLELHWADDRMKLLLKLEDILMKDSIPKQEKFSLVDRLGWANWKFKVKVTNPLSMQVVESKFDDCLRSHTKQILSLKNFENIIVFWSGGIDSTAMLCAILEQIHHNKVKVVMNKFSQKEFPSFYDKQIKNRLEVFDLKEFWRRNTKNDLVLVGDGGDTLWGHVCKEDYENGRGQHLEDPWQMHVEEDMIDSICEWLLPSQIKFETLLDLRTIFNIAMCTQWRTHGSSDLYQGSETSQIVTFFTRSSLLENWVLQNISKIRPRTFAEHRVSLKKFILDFHNDKEYFLHKVKIKSDSLHGFRLFHPVLKGRSPFVLDADEQWHYLPSSPVCSAHEFLQWNSTHRWLTNC